MLCPKISGLQAAAPAPAGGVICIGIEQIARTANVRENPLAYAAPPPEGKTGYGNFDIIYGNFDIILGPFPPKTIAALCHRSRAVGPRSFYCPHHGVLIGDCPLTS